MKTAYYNVHDKKDKYSNIESLHTSKHTFGVREIQTNGDDNKHINHYNQAYTDNTTRY